MEDQVLREKPLNVFSIFNRAKRMCVYHIETTEKDNTENFQSHVSVS